MNRPGDALLSRRSVLPLLGLGLRAGGRGAPGKLPPVRAITRGPKFHWFSYYDKLQFDPTGRYVLGMEVGFEHRTPRADDTIKLGMIDLNEGDRWIELGESRAWCWQQGCMLQWIPGSASEVIWNDREGDRFVARILDVKTRKRRTLPGPIYTLSPDGRWAVAPNFARLQDCRPGYGYVGAVDANKDLRAPGNDGIWRMNLQTGKRELIIPYATAFRIPYEAGGLDQAKHWFNHLLFAPDGERFIFLHRWRGPKQGRSFDTRMFTANLDGKELFVLDPHGKTSHFIWRDARNVLAWSWHPSRRPLLPLRGPHRKGGSRGRGCHDREWPLFVPARKPVDFERHLPRQGPQPEPLSVRHQNPPAAPAGALQIARRVFRRMALRHPPSFQPGRQDGYHRFTTCRRRAADLPHRYPGDGRVTGLSPPASTGRLEWTKNNGNQTTLPPATRCRFSRTHRAGLSPGTAAIRPVPHSLLTDDPGKTHLDLWGWHTSPFYQRWSGRVVPPDHLKKHAVAESYKWGSNLVEIYRGGYPLEQRAGWTRESTAELHRYIHDLDMLAQWFPHRLDGDAAPKAGLTSHWAKGSDVPTNAFPGAIQAMCSLGRTLFDSLAVPPEELLDVMGTEQWPVMHALLFNKCMWPYNPAVSFYTDNHAFDETLPNEIDVSGSNGFGTDDQTSGYYQLPVEIRKQYGFQFWGSQAECRTELSENRFGGLGQPDWVLKQVNDQFRGRARVRGRRNLSPSAMWWINEVEDMCSERNRLYVYGTSQDPIKCAVTATLAGLGQDGLKVETEKGTRGLAPRYPYPSQTAFLQNNYLCVFARHDQDRLMLWRDPERLAHFDNDSPAELLCDPLARTVLLGSERTPEAKSVEFEYVEPAGYKAVWRARLRLECDGRQVEETRTSVMLNDTPYVRLKVERTARGGPVALGARFGVPQYDRLVLDAAEHDQPVDAPVPENLTLKDSSGRNPDLVFLLLSKGRLERVRWAPKQALTLESQLGEHESFELALLAPEGLYEGGGVQELFRHLLEPEELVTLDNAGQAVVTNKLGIPLVKVVRVSGAASHPYQLFEFGRWVFRGAQPSLVHKGEDYLKCYLPAHGSVRIQRYGFLDTVARPGWGCQYTMSLRECRRRDSRVGAVAEVKEVTSFLFAPRLRFKEPVSEVRVDGQPWSYFDGCHVFLPNRRGRYRVEAVEGVAAAPHVARTFAHIESCAWRDERLSFEARLPEWVEGVPEDFDFVALVRHPGRQLVGLDHARLLRSEPSAASIVSFKPGTVSLRFAAQAGGPAVPMADLDADIEGHLGRRSTVMLRPYLSPFHPDHVSLKAAGADPSALRRFDVLVWNYYCLDSLPRELTPAAVKAIHDHVSRGGGLFLIANAIRLVPQLTGAAMGRMRSLHIGHHLNKDCDALGLEAVVKHHPIFRGLEQSGANIFPLLVAQGSDIFKRVLWEGSAAAQGGSVLAKMHVAFKPGQAWEDPIFEPSPVLWEWRVGKGTIVACGCGLRYTLGSPNRWIPSGNALRLVENAVRYLGRGSGDAKVGVLTSPLEAES